MITRIEALNYRCLRDISVPLSRFHVLVGPNASGKTTFLDVIGFMRDLVTEDIDAALSKRTQNPAELLFGRTGDGFELAVEARIPQPLIDKLIGANSPAFDTIRYEIAIGFDETQRQFEFKAEQCLLLKAQPSSPVTHTEFPAARMPRKSLLHTARQSSEKVILKKNPAGNDSFNNEFTTVPSKGWSPSFKLGTHKSALRFLPADEEVAPITLWFRQLLATGIQPIMLNSIALRDPSQPSKANGFLPDGSNLPWVIARFRQERPDAFRDWIAHLRTALPDLSDIEVIEQPWNRFTYLVFHYENDLKVPSWFVSDGTLRLVALTLLAYLNDDEGIYLVEEPENGIHPQAISAVCDALSSVYGAQVLLATHSAIVLNGVDAAHVLCFAKDEKGATAIVSGRDHPNLSQWKGSVSLGTLFASGVLGQ